MKKKTTVLIVAVAMLLVALFCSIKFFLLDNSNSVASDEIRFEIQLDVKEDIGLFIIDREVSGENFSGGISNADKSLLKHDEFLIVSYQRWEFNDIENLDNLKLQFSIIGEYVDPNYENIYPDELTKVMEPIHIDAKYGETFKFKITGNSKEGYKAILEK